MKAAASAGDESAHVARHRRYAWHRDTRRIPVRCRGRRFVDFLRVEAANVVGLEVLGRGAWLGGFRLMATGKNAGLEPSVVRQDGPVTQHGAGGDVDGIAELARFADERIDDLGVAADAGARPHHRAGDDGAGADVAPAAEHRCGARSVAPRQYVTPASTKHGPSIVTPAPTRARRARRPPRGGASAREGAAGSGRRGCRGAPGGTSPARRCRSNTRR